MIGAPKLREKYDGHASDAVVEAELSLINTRLRRKSKHGERVIPLLLDGQQADAFPPQMQDLVFIDFRDETKYFSNTLSLVWRLHNLPFDSDALREFRSALET